MYGLIGKKVRMTQIFNDDGHVVPVTLVEAGPCTVSQIKVEKDNGYNAVQLAYGKKSKNSTNKPTKGHLSKSGIDTAKVMAEFKSINEFDYKLGQQFDSSIFNVGEIIDVKARSKGKGFAGDHNLLYSNIYQLLGEHLDSLVEKGVGLYNNEEIACPLLISNLAAKIMCKFDSPANKSDHEIKNQPSFEQNQRGFFSMILPEFISPLPLPPPPDLAFIRTG